MLKIPIVLFLLWGVIALVECQQKSYTKFEDSITAPNRVIFKSRLIGAENENFVYAVCEESGQYFYFQPRHCNVTIQKQDEKHTCPLHIAFHDAKTDHLSDLIFYPFGDDRVIITWMNNNKDFHVESSVFKILEISTCQLIDVPILADKIIYVVVYKNAADIGFYNRTYCGSRSCKITINNNGEQISGPTDVLKNVDIAFNYPIGIVNPNSSDEGFYMSVGIGSEFNNGKQNEHFHKINGQGKSVEFMTLELTKYARSSSTHGLFSICYPVGQENTTVVCTQYDKSLKLKLNTTIKFEDKELQRWIQPYNLKKGGLLLLTGTASDEGNKYYDSFSIMKIDQDGQKHEAVKVNNLNLNCTFFNNMNVNVLENESGEICAYFACNHDVIDKGKRNDTLQLAIKCLSKAYF